ncbi:MAG: hypothetical protein J6A15_01645 [Clostridia bacterium]|nr:hypothetical protein [Clostridia bacterium]
MKNLNLIFKRGFDIYEVEEYKTPRYYVAVRKTIFGKEKAQKINFDVDTRGGLKIIFLEDVDLKCNGIEKKLLFSDVKNNFIPIEIYKRGYGSDKFVVNEKFYNILENPYLKRKSKYALFDGVVEQIVFSRVECIEGKNMIDYDFYLYDLT